MVFLRSFIQMVAYCCISNHCDCFRYKLIKEVGDGTFGSVWRAINKLSGEVVCLLNHNMSVFLILLCLW